MKLIEGQTYFVKTITDSNEAIVSTYYGTEVNKYTGSVTLLFKPEGSDRILDVEASKIRRIEQ